MTHREFILISGIVAGMATGTTQGVGTWVAVSIVVILLLEWAKWLASD